LADEHGQHVMEAAMELAGPFGLVADRGPYGEPDAAGWRYGYLYARALTIGGGTSEVQRNILGEKVLGLPREP
jgi:alkylation response protein AidB-like acyl-CoA dehydrogenase